MKRIILSVTNDLVTDQRVHRVATTLSNQGAEVTLVGRLLPHSLPVQRAYSTHRMRLLFKRSALFYAEYNFRLFFYLLFKKADILVSNDLDTLLANYLVSVIRRKPLVYDSHEYYTGVPEIQERKIVLFAWRNIERFIFPRLQHIYTVNQSIAKLYEEEYGRHVDVIRNVPVKIDKKNWPTRLELGLPEDKKIIIMQGAGINIHRGAEEAVQAIKLVDDAILLIVGSGDMIPELHKVVANEHLENKVIFKPKMPYEQLAGYTRIADLGLSLDKDMNLNYKFSLPNKLFDYIQAGIPVLCSNLIEVVNIVNTWKIGMITESHDPSHMAEKIKKMLEDAQQMEIWKSNVIKAGAELCWENEEKQLMKIYSKLLQEYEAH